MTYFRIRAAAAGLTTMVLLGTSCSSTTEATRSSVVESIADELVTPVYQNLAATTEKLSTAISELCDTPSEMALEAAQERLNETEAAWHRSATVRIGPTQWRRTTNVFSTKVDPERVDNLLKNDAVAVLDADYIGSKTATTQHGLGTIQYLLTTSENPSTTVDFVIEPRRCEYLSAASEAMTFESVELQAEWSESWNDGDPYIATLVSSDPEQTVDGLVNDSIFVLEELHTMRLDPILDGDVPAESSGLTGDIAFQNRFESVRQVLIGPNSTSGISSLLPEDLALRLRDQIDQVDTAFFDAPQPLDSIPVDSAAIETLRSAVEQLQITASTEVASQLGVTLAFSDADGDSG